MCSLQATRSVEVTSPLGGDTLLFRRMTAREELGRPFEFEIEFLSENHDVKLEKLVGESMTVRLNVADDKERFFDGVVARFAHVGTSGVHSVYQATLRPWIWLLSHTSDCRIYQEMSIPDIVKEVFRDNGFSDFKEKLSESYSALEYSVQYRETDFDFVSRLMERAGIYYFFEHEKGKHTLVLADSASAHQAIAGYDKIPYRPPENSDEEREIIHGWRVGKEVQATDYVLNDFDFEKPKSKLEVKSNIRRQDQAPKLELYEYPGEYLEKSDGEAMAKARIEALQARYERTHGETNARGLATGALFKLTDYPRKDQNREYLIVSAVHELESDDYRTGAGGGGTPYACHFDAIDSKESFRPERRTPRPVMPGPQTALVVGKSGEEIWTDKYGRVRLQFHWDRLGESDEKSSCWVRVSQVWAGKKFGGLHIPRIGQEVIVEFLDGDPDRPIVTGAVYNGDQMPPYALPGDATQSGIKSQSSKDGSDKNCNEFRFEDKKGEEQVYIHAEKDQLVEILNDCATEIGNDQALKVENDRTLEIGNDQKLEVKNDRTAEIGNNDELDVKKKLTITAGDEISLKCGQSEMVLKKDGTITIMGMKITIDGSTKIEVKSSAQIDIKGTQTKVEATQLEMKGSAMAKLAGAMVDIAGDGMVKVKGGVTMIN